MDNRFYEVKEYIKDCGSEAKKILLYQNERTNGVIWYVPKGKEVPAHYHPGTDDVWVILQGEGLYLLGEGETRTVSAGMIIPAETGRIHGIVGSSEEPLVFAAVSAPMPVEMIKV